MFKCECYPNHEICRNRSTCEFWIPLNQELQQVYRQIKFEMEKLKTLKERRQEYYQILFEIQNHVYTEAININGKLTLVPEKNALGEDITRPEHVQAGLNYDIMLEIQDQESIIRALRFKEHDILKILKKRADKYD